MTDDGVHLVEFDAYLKHFTKASAPTHEAEVLLLTCMDFRFFEEIARRMKGVKYDHVILAGAALGAVVPGKEAWHQTFFDHLGLARKLHGIKKVMVIEHRDCGAYGPKGFGLLPLKPKPKRERVVHQQQVAKLKGEIPRVLRFAALLLDVPPEEGPWMCDQVE